MSFGKSKPHKKLPNSNDILSCVSDIEIFEHYLGDIPNKVISSPLREDTNPSFSLFHSRNHNMMLFKDFASGDVGDCFVFVMRLFKLSSKTEAFNKVANDFNLNQFELNSSLSYSLPKRRNGKKTTRPKSLDRVDIAVTVRSWENRDRDYWQKKYGLSKNQLEYCGVLPISHYFINGYCNKADDLAYAFIEYKDKKQTFKIYQPFNKDRKWINNNDFSVWELWSQLPDTGETLIIGSSRKDSMVIKSLFPSNKITSVALQSEGVVPKLIVVNELKYRFKRIFVMYDNDFDNPKNPGRKAGKDLSSLFGCNQIEIPEHYKTKDPSDFVEKYGSKNLKTLILKLTNNI